MRPRWLCLIGALAVPDVAAGQSVALLDTAPLQAARLRESSGVTSSSRPGVYWTHNDSGDGPYLYATDSSGRDLGRVTIGGARAIDWESIDAGPCVTAPGRCLYIGDIGDNQSRRRSVTIYRVAEPVPPGSADDTLRTVPLLDSIVIRYPGGSRDAETVIVTPDSMLLLVSKPHSGRPHLYRLDLRRRPPPTVADAGPLAIDISIPRGRLVTGGSISPDARFVVLRTYVSLHFFRYASGGNLAPVAGPTGIPIPFIEAQGEGIAFEGPDRLVLTSEAGAARRPTIARLRVVLPAP